MSYDEQVRHDVEDALLGASMEDNWAAEDLCSAALAVVPEGTLKIDGRFVRVEIASGTNYTSKTHYTPLYRIVDDSDA
jgi:hypothetical protein